MLNFLPIILNIFFLLKYFYLFFEIFAKKWQKINKRFYFLQILLNFLSVLINSRFIFYFHFDTFDFNLLKKLYHKKK
ncbi:hypothetical protein MDIS_02310 [Mesomycoplasma dispar]|nr:hypothetical protein MDIS_02310 [Mesomycoplasma dispar]